MLSKLIKWMRIDEKLSWNALEDRSRTITNKRGFTDLAHFVNQETFNFLYRMFQSQMVFISKYIKQIGSFLGLFE